MSRVAVVTGGGRGIGAATAVALAGQRFDVAITYNVNRDAANATVQACTNAGVRATTHQVDVAVEADVTRLFGEVDDMLGRVTALVNNAGIVAPPTTVVEMAGPRIERMLAVNVLGPFLCAREAIKRMSTDRGGPGGVIVNVSSAAARLGSPGEYVDYAASKAAVDTLTIGLAKEVAKEGIIVNAVRPGIIETEIHASGGQPDRARRLSATIPIGRPGTAHEVAELITWLCSGAPNYLTGAVIDISGAR